MSENEEVPECIGNYGQFGLSCELCEWAGDCMELQAETEAILERVPLWLN